MHSYLISDNRDTALGLRLAGIEGVILHQRDEILAKIKELVNDPEIGIVFITEKANDLVNEEIMELRKNRAFPLFSVIPDRWGYQKEKAITKYITEAVGIS